MSEYFLGEMRIFAGSFEPANWKFCNGQQLQISQYEALFALIGFVWGGDGNAHFALPDLRGRVPVGQGQGTGLTSRVLGQMGGSSQCTLTVSNLVAHNHAFHCTTTNNATSPSPSSNCGLANIAPANGNQMVMYAPNTAVQPSNMVAMDQTAMSSAPGGSQPHSNLMSYLALNYIICVQGGLYPTH